MTERTPPGGSLTLEPPHPVGAVTDDQAVAQTPRIDPAVKQQIDSVVAQFVDALISADPHSPAFDTHLRAIHTMGDADVRASASVSNRLLDRPAGAISAGVFDPKSNISESLVRLRRTVEDLDPTQQGVFGRKRRWGTLPFGNSLRDYFHRYESSQKNLDAIIQSLLAGQDELQKDNASLEQEKANAWAIKGRLEQYVYMASVLDQQLSEQIAAIESSDPERSRRLREDVLFYVRQKRQDLLTQLAVNVQGFLAMDLVKRNNVELIKGVDRATTTTLSALRTAIIVAQALANQRLVLNQIHAINATTSNLIESTSEMLRQQSDQVYQQAADSTIQLQKLQAAFDNIYASIEAIDVYKVQALDSMKKTIEALSTEVSKAHGHLQRAHPALPGKDSDVGALVVPAARSR